MAFLKSKANIVFLFIILLLVSGLSGVSYFAYKTHNDYVNTSASLSENKSSLNDSKKQIEELEIQIENLKSEVEKNAAFSQEEKDALTAQLNDVKTQNGTLSNQITDLKTKTQQLEAQIEQLKVEKRREELQKLIILPKVAQSQTAAEGVCYLTFDDGPSDNTLKILDVLDKYKVKGTFFVTGSSKSQYMKEIAKRGHAIGLHTATHKYDSIYKDINSYLEDVKSISDIVYKETGVRSNIMRFPGGSSNMISQKYCQGIMTDLTKRMTDLGYAYFDWNVDSGDANAASVPADVLVQNVLNGAKGKKSICILMHDNGAKGTTAEALPRIIEGLAAMGYKFETLDATSYGYHQPVKN